MGPLAGYRILEIKGIGPGPYAGMLLADLGAEVVVIERPGQLPGLAPPSVVDLFSRGKRNVALDLKTDEGREALLRLVGSADALFEGFRPGVAERLGFGPDVCLGRNPRLVYGRITGWGQDGPLAPMAGHDINYISLTGVLDAIGSPDRPALPLNLVGDFAGGSLFLVIGMLAALLEAHKSGRGQVVDAAITDGTAHLMTMIYTLSRLGLWHTARERNMLDGGAPFYGVYRTKDDRFMSVGALEPQFFSRFAELIGLPEHLSNNQNDPSTWKELKTALSDAFVTKTRDEWTTVFADSDACVAPVLNYTEAPDHPHNAARATYLENTAGVQPSPAPRFSRSRCEAPAAPRASGTDTLQVLGDWGFEQHEIEELVRSGALGDA